jgi:hypothetical protein
MTKSKRMKYVGDVLCLGENRNVCRALVGDIKE